MDFQVRMHYLKSLALHDLIVGFIKSVFYSFGIKVFELKGMS